jgi:hypothetical protein
MPLANDVTALLAVSGLRAHELVVVGTLLAVLVAAGVREFVRSRREKAERSTREKQQPNAKT